MRSEIAARRLEGVPPKLRTRLLAAHAQGELAPGAIAVIARFVGEVDRRREPLASPSRAAFDAACAKEATLSLLLRTLQTFAPEVGLAEGRAARRAWYESRSTRTGVGRGGTQVRRVPGTSWPAEWQALLPGLLDAPIRDSSIRRYVGSVDRCAETFGSLDAPSKLSWLLGYRLAKAFEAQGLRPATGQAYIEGLIGLGRHGGAEPYDIDGLRAIRAWLQRKTRRGGKLKEARVEALMAQGGYEHVLRTILSELELARSLPAWSAAAEDARARAAMLAVTVNIPPRTGDMAVWRLGEELVREPEGAWWLRWRQEKTHRVLDPGRLWPEVGAVLDEHLLGGRPDRHVHLRYSQLLGLNWLTHTAVPHASAWPSAQVKAVLGVPLHDLRTLLAEFLRDIDPEHAPDLVQAMLGHGSRAAGEEYRALLAGETAAAAWAEIRTEIARSW